MNKPTYDLIPRFSDDEDEDTTHYLTPYADRSTPVGAMIAETHKQRLEITLNRFKVQYAKEELELFTEHDSKLVLKYIRFTVKMKKELENEPEVAHYMNQYLDQSRTVFVRNMGVLHQAFLARAAELSHRGIDVEPYRKPLLERIMDALKGR